MYFQLIHFFRNRQTVNFNLINFNHKKMYYFGIFRDTLIVNINRCIYWLLNYDDYICSIHDIYH